MLGAFEGTVLRATLLCSFQTGQLVAHTYAEAWRRESSRALKHLQSGVGLAGRRLDNLRDETPQSAT